ncbi:MAG: class I SAM-dependent methyltransferase [Anaerolineae bacterium]
MNVYDHVADRYDRAVQPLERLLLDGLRRGLFSHLAGRVLELGVGTGPNLPYYPPQAHVLACDLSAEMLPRARRRPGGARALFVQADASALPVQAESLDYVTASLVFCSLEDPAGTLQEVLRVLRPGGWLVLLEHVRGLNPFTRFLTDLLAPTWHRITHTCRLDRDTGETVARSGLQIVATSAHLFGLVQVILARKA